MNSNIKTHHKLHLNIMVTLNIHKVKKLYIANKLNIKRPKKKGDISTSNECLYNNFFL